MASVWRARDETLARPVAVKLLFARDDRDHETLVSRFLREARIAASVQHRNVIQIVDFGTTEAGQPFMVMELLEGESLGDRLHRSGALSLEETVHIASMTLRGLAAVHDAGIIHRDLKPDNVYLKEEGGIIYPKILDFGISRSVEPASGRRSALTTREGVIVGTPEYMSPEQARGLKEIDRRTDLYSMGVMLYQMLTGALPFHTENVGDLIIKIVTTPAPNPRELRADIPEALCDVVMRALSKEPQNRFATAADMQRALLTAGADALGGSLRRTLSDLPPSSVVAFEESLSGIPRDRPLSAEFPLGSLTDEIDTQSLRLQGAAAPAATAVTQQTLTTREFAARFGNRKVHPAVWLVAAALVIGSAAMWLSKSNESVAARTLAPKPAAPAPLVKLELRNVPAGAVITIDGKRAEDHAELPRDGRAHDVIVSAEGKLPWQTTFTAGADSSYDVRLNDAPAAIPTGADLPSPEPTAAPAAASPAPKKVVRKPGALSGKTSGKSPGALRKLDF